MLNGPPGDLAMLGKTTATLQRNVLNDLLDIVGAANFKWVDRQKGELRIFNRRVYLFGANNEDAESKLRGATFAGAYCDEVSLYPQSVFNQLMARLSVPGAQCFCNTNPDSPFHWFNVDFIENEAIVNKRMWHFTMEDNLSLDPEYVQALMTEYSGVWYDRMILGLWVVAEGLIYDMFNTAAHLVDTIEIVRTFHPRFVRWYVACDYGTSSVMSWGLYAVLPNGTTLKVREMYYDAVVEKVQKSDSQFGDMFDAWIAGSVEYIYGSEMKTQLALNYVYVDPSAASWKVELRTRSYLVQDANNDVIDGIRYVGSQLTKNLYLVDKRCTNTFKEYRTYSWDAKAQASGIDRPIKKNDHTCDTDRYMLYTQSLHGRSGVYGVQ